MKYKIAVIMLLLVLITLQAWRCGRKRDIGEVRDWVQKTSIESEKIEFPFYVYKDFGEKKNTHFYPSGRMGDDLAFTMIGNCRENPYSGKSCIQCSYMTGDKEKIKMRWSGLFWIIPANNWGWVKESGYCLTGAKKLFFYARGEKGGEFIEFGMGGIDGDYPDSGYACPLKVTLEKEWKRYSIELQDVDLSYVIGGFFWSINSEYNPDGAVFYLDDIYYSKSLN